MSEEKLITQFGCQPLTPQLLRRIETIAQEKDLDLHPFLRRGIFFSHRDLEKILDDYENKRSFYIYTGRGPSAGSLHLGHLVPFLFTAYLQKLFGVYVVIQITDDEKFLFRKCSMEEIEINALSNIKDIMACGFDPSKTFIFRNTEYIQNMYKNVLRIQAHITNSQAFATFGTQMSDNIGQTSFCALQIAPALYTTFPVLESTKQRCLIPQGIDQDPYFRLGRDVCPRLKHPKPSLIHSGFLMSLGGCGTKMSSSEPKSAIFMTDTPQQIRKKLNASVSGGKESKEDQMLLGADLKVDVAFQYLRYFIPDDQELEDLRNAYGEGGTVTPKLLTSEVKSRCIQIISNLVLVHQESRAQITPELVRQFCTM